MEDKRSIALLEEMRLELQNNVVLFNSRLSGLNDQKQIVDIRREQLDILEDMVIRHRRALDWMEGKPVKPMTHFGEGVLIGVFGGAE